MSESEEKHLRLKVKQLICGSLNGIRIRKSLPQPYMPWTGMQVHRKVREPEFRDCGVFLEQGLLLTVDRWIEGR